MAIESLATRNYAFEKIGVASWLGNHIASVGIIQPTEIQKYCIPAILEGSDTVGCAPTGSGKTAAFALPIIQNLAIDPYGIFAIVLAPTRELAFQLSEQFKMLGKTIGIKIAVIVGGADAMEQSSLLNQSPHVVIATPGRLSYHLHSGQPPLLHKIKYVVLDEADLILRETFSEDLKTIFQLLPSKRQTILFSATMTETMKRMCETFPSNVFLWNATINYSKQLDQRYILTPAQVKQSYFLEVIKSVMQERPQPMIVFTHTCRSCQVISLLLQQSNFLCVTLHSRLSQAQRLASLSRFKSGEVYILVATDIASRGLDIPQVNYVINLNVPASPVDYVHRIGRASRADKSGRSITFVTQFDILRLQNIEKYTGFNLAEYSIDEKEALKSLYHVGTLERKIQMKCGTVRK